jgi:transcriptional antiterminator
MLDLISILRELKKTTGDIDTTKVLAAKYGISQRHMARILKQFDMATPRGRPSNLSDEDMKKINTLLLKKANSVEELALDHNVSAQTIRRRLRQYRKQLVTKQRTGEK